VLKSVKPARQPPGRAHLCFWILAGDVGVDAFPNSDEDAIEIMSPGKRRGVGKFPLAFAHQAL